MRPMSAQKLGRTLVEALKRCNLLLQKAKGSVCNMEDYLSYDNNDSGYDYNLSTYTYSDFDYEDNSDSKAAEAITKYLYPTFIVITVFGNITSAVVLYNLGCKVLATCSYLSLLCLLDIFLVMSACGDDWLVQFMGYSSTEQLMNNSDGFCRSFTFLKSFANQLSKWLLVTVAVEGLWLVHDPKKCSRILTKFRARTTMLLLTLLTSLINVHYFWTFKMMELKENGDVVTFCAFIKGGVAYNKTFQVTIWPLMDLMLNDILPMTVISVCIVMSVVKFVRKKRSKDDTEASESKTYFIWGARVINQLLFVMGIMGLLFVALNIPHLAWKLKTQYSYEKIFPNDQKTTLSDYSNTDFSSLEFNAVVSEFHRKTLIKTSVAAVWYAFLSCKIFIYAAFSSKFRQEFRRSICCERFINKQQRRPSVRPKNKSTESETMLTKTNKDIP